MNPKVKSLLVLIAVSLPLVFGYRYMEMHDQVINETRASLANKVKDAAEEISETVNELVPVNIAISEELTSGRLARNEQAIVARLEQAKDKYSNVFGAGVAFLPDTFPNRKYYAPLLVNRDGGRTLVQIEDVYDYTEEQYQWYHRPLEEGPVWQEPHYGRASQAFIANFTSPFFEHLPDGSTRNLGVVFTSMSLDQYQNLVGDQGFGATGYGFLLSRKGAFVSHPDDAYVTENKTIEDWAAETVDSGMESLAKAAVAGVRSVEIRKDPKTGENQWVFVEPIISTGWTLGVVYSHNHIPEMSSLGMARMLFLGSGVLMLVIFIVLYAGRPKPEALAAA